MNQTYNALQTTFAINWLSNLVSNQKNTVPNLQSEAQERILKLLGLQASAPNVDGSPLIGNWNLEWGPVVYSHSNVDGTQKVVADNTMFMVNNRKSSTAPYGDTFIIAIAGTNPISSYGWITEDFTVNETVDWHSVSPTNNTDAKISKGTSIGLQILLNDMKSSMNAGPEIGIVDKLREITSNIATQPLPARTKIIVTGHSLGGALSAALAQLLYDAQNTTAVSNPVIPSWDPNYLFNVCAMPTAGATPGNIEFARYYDTCLGVNTIRIWNHIDVVPHGWQKSMLDEVSSLYAPAIPKNVFIDTAVLAAKEKANKSGVIYYQLLEQVAGLHGKVNTAIVNDQTKINTFINNVGKARLKTYIESIINKLPATPILKPLMKFSAGLIADALIAMIENKSKSEFEKAIQSLPVALRELLIISYDKIHPLALDFANFFVQLGFQHVNAYITFMGITSFSDLMKTSNPNNKPS